MKDANLKMILVSSSIPAWRSAYLEELGIRCVEIPTVPETGEEVQRLRKDTLAYSKRTKIKLEAEAALGDAESLSFGDIACSVNPKGVAFARRMLKESLEPIRKSFSEYDVIPFGITRSTSVDFDLEHDPGCQHGVEAFAHGGTWWAYRFGFSEDMPKNDVPNVSVIANSAGLDVTINAELQPSQKVLLDRIENAPSEFNKLLSAHGRLWLKTYLKFEHQPRFYHWILADLKPPGEFDGGGIVQIRRNHEAAFEKERKHWLHEIVSRNEELSTEQKQHLSSRNSRLNLAIRLVQPFQRDARIWTLQPKEQVEEIVCAVQRMKPLVDFFVKES